MRDSDVLVLPSIEEGSALVTSKPVEVDVFCSYRMHQVPYASIPKML